MDVVKGFLGLLICLLIGEAVVVAVDVPIPGSVVGMVVLFVFLCVVREVPDGLRVASEGLLKVLPLLLVPAGVGLMNHFGVLSEYWMVLLLALVASTFVTMFVVAAILKLLSQEKQ